MNNNLTQEEVERHWRKIFGKKAAIKIYPEYISRASQRRGKGKLPFGTVRVMVHSTEFAQKVFGGIHFLGT